VEGGLRVSAYMHVWTMLAGAGCAVRLVGYRMGGQAGHALAVFEDSTTRSQCHPESGGRK
jgi:hypothetical protein